MNIISPVFAPNARTTRRVETITAAVMARVASKERARHAKSLSGHQSGHKAAQAQRTRETYALLKQVAAAYPGSTAKDLAIMSGITKGSIEMQLRRHTADFFLLPGERVNGRKLPRRIWVRAEE